MAVELLINPQSLEGRYIESLNLCFGNWGNEHTYKWAFKGKGFEPTDIMVLTETGEWIAGSAVSYRTLALNAKEIKIGLMTGSWTLPEARGKGCFTKIIDESLTLAKLRGALCIGAFVIETNASYRCLKNVGFIEIPSYYMSYTRRGGIAGGEPAAVKALNDTPEMRAKIFAASRNKAEGHILYTFEQWQHQFLDRPNGTKLFAVENSYVIIEELEDTNRILAVYGHEEQAAKALLTEAVKAGKALQCFTTNESVKNIYAALGYNILNGYFMVSENADGVSHIVLQSGDRM